MHTRPLGHFFVLAIRPSGANKSQSSIGFQKSLTLESRSGNRVPDKTAGDVSPPSTSTDGNPFRQTPRRNIVALWASYPAHGNQLHTWKSPAHPGSEHHACRMIFSPTRRFNELRRHQIGPAAGTYSLPTEPRQRDGDTGHQNMCFSIPRCAMILLPISSMEVWVVFREGMFSRRKMRSATASSWPQRSSLA